MKLFLMGINGGQSEDAVECGKRTFRGVSKRV